MSRLPRPTYANVVASLALFVALGGTAVAAANALPRNSVKARQIASRAVGTAELKNNAVNSRKVRNGTLRREDFAANQLPQGAQGLQGPQGLPGAAGPQGDAGPQGPPGPTVSASDSVDEDFPLAPVNSTTDTDPIEVPITTTFPSRLVATVAARIFDDSPDGAPTRATCELSLDEPGNLLTGDRITQEMAVTLVDTNLEDTIALTGRSPVLPPGTHYVALHCLSQDTGITFAEGDMTVIAVASG